MIFRLLILPFVWVFLCFMGILMLIGGGLTWALTGEPYVIRLVVGNNK